MLIASVVIRLPLKIQHLYLYNLLCKGEQGMPHHMTLLQFVSRIVLFFCLFLISFSVSLRASPSQQATAPKPDAKTDTNQSEVRKLDPRQVIEREARGGDKHTYEITLESGQYLHLIAEQLGVDVVVTAIAPDGKKIIDIDSPNRTLGTEILHLFAETSGVYRIIITATGSDVGKYRLRVAALRSATEEDRQRVDAIKKAQESKKMRADAFRLFDAGKFGESLALYEQYLAIQENAFGREHPLTASAITELGEFRRRKGDEEKAEQLFKRALSIYEKSSADHPLGIAYTLHRLGVLYMEKSDFEESERYYDRAREVYERLLGKDNFSYAAVTNDEAILYQESGRYAKTKELYDRVLAIMEKRRGKDHPDVASVLNSIGVMWDTRGDFEKAEPYYEKALAIFAKYREKQGKDYPQTAQVMSNLAMTLESKGDYAKAEEFYNQALEIRKRTLPEGHPYTITSLLNLAGFYRNQGDTEKAETFSQQARALQEKRGEKDTLGVAQINSTLALVAESRGVNNEAERLYQQALEIKENKLGKEHPAVANTLNNLASLYEKKGDYNKAEALYQRALQIRQKALGNDHPLTERTLSHLAVLYRQKRETAKAVRLQRQANDIVERNLVRNLISGSERQKLAYVNKVTDGADFTLSLHLQAAQRNGEANRAALTMILRRKGRALDAMADAIAVLKNNADAESKKLLDDLAQVRQEITALYNQGDNNKQQQITARLKQLQESEETLERQISSKSAEYKPQLAFVALDDIQKAIPQGAVLIEYAVYHPFQITRKGEVSPRYVAYVLRRKGEPVWVELGDAARIEQQVTAFRLALREKRSDVRRLAATLYKTILQPVRPLLGNSRRVFLSPDGILNLVPFAALVDARGQYLVKQFLFTYLTSGRDLLRLQAHTSSKRAAMVIADPDFDSSSSNTSAKQYESNSEHPEAGDNQQTRILEREEEGKGNALSLRIGGKEFALLKRLSGTTMEAQEIKMMLPDATVLIQGNATETALKQVSSPSILHIATHGFFLADNTEAQDGKALVGMRLAVRKEQGKGDEVLRGTKPVNPLLRSGLFLAGANLGRSGADDGTLTALEAAGLDLHGTQLVVLSACDTGVGEVKNGDGVYGLRRALVLAGSESQMMSLWAISDKGTQELMVDYYKRLKVGEGRGEALRNVQLKMLTNPKRKHPFYWASFIQSGEWANLDGKRETSKK
jgi:CHAT domain-containing protein/Tfp pilus assembly protein PilF